MAFCHHRRGILSLRVPEEATDVIRSRTPFKSPADIAPREVVFAAEDSGKASGTATLAQGDVDRRIAVVVVSLFGTSDKSAEIVVVLHRQAPGRRTVLEGCATVDPDETAVLDISAITLRRRRHHGTDALPILAARAPHETAAVHARDLKRAARHASDITRPRIVADEPARVLPTADRYLNNAIAEIRANGPANETSAVLVLPRDLSDDLQIGDGRAGCCAEESDITIRSRVVDLQANDLVSIAVKSPRECVRTPPVNATEFSGLALH